MDDQEEGNSYFNSAEEAEEAVRNIGQAPMLESVQEMLRQQQLKECRSKEINLGDLEESLKRTKEEREALGVRLYNLQQQLAASQIKLEGTSAQIVDSSAASADVDQAVKQSKQTHEETIVERRDLEERIRNAREEENAVKAAVKQVEEYLKETRSEIALMRRATHKTEETVNKLERDKERQDFYINSKIERVKQLQDELELVDAQLLEQRAQTKAAEDTLREAHHEMQKTVFEKNQVIQSWNTTLLSLQRRDEAYQAVLTTINDKREEHETVRNEIEGIKSRCISVQGSNEKIVERQVRQEYAMKLLDDNLKKLDTEHEKLTERYSILQSSLDQQEKESRALKGTYASRTSKVNNILSQIQVIDRQRFAAEEEESKLANDKTTMSKASKNLVQTALKLQKQIHETEIEYANMENDFSRIRLEKLDMKSDVEQLQMQLDQKLQYMQDQERLVDKYKLEIRQRNDEIEKKMYLVDRLTRKYDTMTSNEEEPENLGPLESTIKSLKKDTQALLVENREMERRWLNLQTELVTIAKDSEIEASRVHELGCTATILDHKKARLDQQINVQTKELKEFEANVRKMHNDIHRMNEKIADNKEKHDKLQYVNDCLQSDYIEELKELEKQSIEVESRIEKIKLEKKTLLDEMMECERQLKLWEKKILLEKETQAALDPSIGQSDIKAMEKEIHRMKIRYETLTREQEKMIKEMEVAILKRDTISSRKATNKTNTLKNKKNPVDLIPDMTVSDLNRSLKLQRKQVKLIQNECDKCEVEIQDKTKDVDSLVQDVEKLSLELEASKQNMDSLKSTLNDHIYTKQKNLEKMNRLRILAEKYIEFSKNPAVDIPMCPEEAEVQLEESKDQIKNIQQTITLMSTTYPHLNEVFDRVGKLLEE